jgi:hypothetical protein
MLISCLDHSSTLKTEEIYSSETSADIQRVHSVTFQTIEPLMIILNYVCSLILQRNETTQHKGH